MGTNYYLRKGICKECKHPAEELHIGKSSVGWTFSFRAHDEPFIHSAKDWKNQMKEGVIFDEYNEKMSEGAFWDYVEKKKVAPNKHARDYPKDGWIDDEGNSFSNYEFS